MTFYFSTTKTIGALILPTGFASKADYCQNYGDAECVEVSNQMNNDSLHNFVIEIAIDKPDGLFDHFEYPVLDHYDRVFMLPLPLINSGNRRMVTEAELHQWNAEKAKWPPIP